MRAVSRALKGIGEGAAVVLMIGWFALFAFVGIGGISYRKDCVTETGTVTKDWTVTWFSPLPFLFRPSEDGCEVHAGTRVALNAIGLFPFAEQSVERAIAKSADETGDSDVAYYADLFRSIKDLIDYNTAHADDEDLTGGITQVRKTAEEVGDLTPPDSVRSEHNELVALLLSSADDVEKFSAAMELDDRKTALKYGRRMERGGKRQVELFETIRTTLGGEQP